MSNPAFAPDLTLSTITSSAVAVYIIQQLKTVSWWPALSKHFQGAARQWSALLAAFSTVGLQWQWTGATHTLIISNLTLGVILLGLWHWLAHFSTQEIIYRAVANAPQVPK